MKYMMYNDIIHFVKENYKIWLFYLLIVLSSLICTSQILKEEGFNLFLRTSGMSFHIQKLPLLVNLFCLFQGVFTIYVVLHLFTHQLNGGVDNFFLRMKPTYFSAYKSINMILLIGIFKLIEYIIICLLTLWFISVDYLLVLRLLLFDIGFSCCLAFISLILYICFYHNKMLFALILIALLIFLYFIQFQFLYQESLWYTPLIIFPLLLLIYQFIFKKAYIAVFEGGNL